ncbi:MAG: MerR family transcriptional regulator [Atopobiaceae bacterium]|nr:MerR family transcriptional regulator [Atopobiaceae bacterium]
MAHPKGRRSHRSQDLLTTGEFARMCDTTKETLYYYAERGIFSPCHIGENGYAYYSPRQIYLFNTISELRYLGASVDQIAAYLLAHNSKALVVLASDLVVKLEREEDALRQKRSLILREMAQTALGHTGPNEAPQVVNMPETVLVVTKPTGDDVSATALDRLSASHIRHCRRVGLIDKSPSGDVLYYQSLGLSSSAIGRRGVFSTVNMVTTSISKSNRLVKRPAGTYLSWFAFGPYDQQSLDAELGRFVSAAHQLGLVIAGEIYSADYLSHLSVDYYSEEYPREYLALVRPQA